ncbi:Glucose-1-phosphate cytidylyltransferase (EC 2.7.7.33) [Azospirillum argentinense]|uniref:glucose-1-phosphate cytidylyltransferase n=1 Tax=Azospirillum TaxID=191 RepID=UPI000E0A787B|nr:glucose-1-phosphate cytidylyltransferase [Azospirillum brasilense]
MVRKAVILAGGMGTRLAEETEIKPKPLVEIGGRPILWHIMKIYSEYGINDFIVCLGYKGYLIKEYFSNYYLHMADVTFDLASNSMEVHHGRAENWRITLVDTGLETMTGGRVRRVRDFIGDETFCLTYGDGVSNVNIADLIDFHQSHGKLATVTAVRPPGRFGALEIDGTSVTGFREKPLGDGGWINGGFFVMSPKMIDYIEADHTTLESEPLTRLASDGQLHAFHHDGFWQPMDTIRDRNHLEKLWAGGGAPWKVW